MNDDILKRLVDKARGLFIWADTACRFIKYRNSLATFARERLSAYSKKEEEEEAIGT